MLRLTLKSHKEREGINCIIWVRLGRDCLSLTGNGDVPFYVQSAQVSGHKVITPDSSWD